MNWVVFRKIYVLASMVMLIFFGNVATAQPVISRLKTGETGFATREYIEFYNNSDAAIDVSGWCIAYSPAADSSKSTLGCLQSPSEEYRLMLAARSYVRLATTEFLSTVPGFSPDLTFSSGLSAASGHIRLYDKNKNELDKIAWGSAVSPEGLAIPAHQSGKIFARHVSMDNPVNFVDTNRNELDFFEAQISQLPESGLYEEVIIVDLCTNVSGDQPSIPEGYFLNAIGDCEQQSTQVVYPSLEISEVLPNAISYDDGQEFIEIYNPNSATVNLGGYRLELGPAYLKGYSFEADIELGPGEYYVLSDLESGIILPNSSGSLRLKNPAGDVIFETPQYLAPPEENSWAVVSGIWQYTNQITQGQANAASTPESLEESEVEGGLQECDAGKFRNPETGRCKTVEVNTGHKDCPIGQERNPATNRCRISTQASSLTPCKPGQERNPETNRCRNAVLASAILKPCAEGQERNPSTNRCRSVLADGSATLASVQDVPTSHNAAGKLFTKNGIILGLVVAGAIFYAVYEWRIEILRIASRLSRKLGIAHAIVGIMKR